MNAVQLEKQAAQLLVLADEPSADHRTHFGLASLLHQLDTIRPDGGSRLPRAKRAYRSTLNFAQLQLQTGPERTATDAYL